MSSNPVSFRDSNCLIARGIKGDPQALTAARAGAVASTAFTAMMIVSSLALFVIAAMGAAGHFSGVVLGGTVAGLAGGTLLMFMASRVALPKTPDFGPDFKGQFCEYVVDQRIENASEYRLNVRDESGKLVQRYVTKEEFLEAGSKEGLVQNLRQDHKVEKVAESYKHDRISTEAAMDYRVIAIMSIIAAVMITLGALTATGTLPLSSARVVLISSFIGMDGISYIASRSMKKQRKATKAALDKLAEALNPTVKARSI